jgi:hypothetical protein
MFANFRGSLSKNGGRFIKICGILPKFYGICIKIGGRFVSHS